MAITSAGMSRRGVLGEVGSSRSADQGRDLRGNIGHVGVTAVLTAIGAFVGFSAVAAHLAALPSEPGRRDYSGQVWHLGIMTGFVVLLGASSVVVVVKGVIGRRVAFILLGVVGLVAGLVSALVTFGALLGGGWDG